jgi:beta-glucanase (GH16 family)
MQLKAEYIPGCINYWSPDWHPVKGCYNYFTGVINSTQTYKYGYFEMRCARPRAKMGNANAFWLWSEINRYNEIDMFEHTYWGGQDSSSISGSYYGSDKVGHHPVKYTVPAGLPGLTSFHTYAMEWSPQRLIWYFDGKEIGNDFNDTAITNQPMYVIVNYDLDNYIKTLNNSPFPLYMSIDYVKVTQLTCDCGTTVSINTTSQLNNFNYAVKKSITINNTATTITVQNASVSLRATDGITINGNFAVPLGVEFYAATHACPQ